MRFISLLLLTFFLTAIINAPRSMAEGVTLSTLEWPPYTGLSLPKAGATSEVIRQAFAKINIDIKVISLPWKRAITTAGNNEAVVAYFPGYNCKHKEGFIASDPVGSGPLGLAEHVEAPIAWQSVDDLGEQQLKIGTVLGYANTQEFDEKAGTGWVRAIAAKDDLTNLKKLVRRRIDAVVIDKLVMSYLLVTEPSLKDHAKSIQFNSKPLEEKSLHVCFTDDEAGRALLERFNMGLKQVDSDKIVSDYFANEF